ncbi:hypothetical protein K3495_g17438, partial [Podosphaera aphanis]
MDVVHRQLSQVHDRLAGLEGNECPVTSNSEKVVILKNPPRKVTQGIKPTKFPSFNGNRASYPGWRKFILNALKVDWNTFEYDDTQVFMMIYQSLEDTAHSQSVGFFEMGGWSKEDRPEEFIEFLDRANNDPTRIKRAASELHDLKMGEKQRWTSFYPIWANK